jgi:hypothetical protein
LIFDAQKQRRRLQKREQITEDHIHEQIPQKTLLDPIQTKSNVNTFFEDEKPGQAQGEPS